MNAPAESTATLARVEQGGALARLDEMIPVERLLARVGQIRDARDKVMQEGVHYGKIPGVDKPTLLKPGAETLCMAFQLAPDFDLDERREGDHLEVVVTCKLVHVPSGAYVGSGIGSCSTMESKYAYRKGVRLCPKCGKAAIIKGQGQFGGGWVCWKKKDGCNAKFSDGDRSIESQSVDRVANEDVADQYNTVRKMACKRAHVAAVLFVTGASELFTQDVEDMPRAAGDDGHRDAKPGNGNGGARQAAPAGQRNAPAQGTPTDTDLEKALAEIAAIATVAGLAEHAKSNRGKRWTKAQVEALKEASSKRHAEIEKQSDYQDAGDPPPPDDEIPF